LNGIVPAPATADLLEPWQVWYDVCELANLEGGETKIDEKSAKRATRMEQLRKMAQSRDFHNYEAGNSYLMTYLQELVLHPSSPKRLCWTVLGMLLIIYDMIMLPMSAFDLPLDDLAVVMSWFIASFWSIDTVAQFFVGFYAHNKLEMRVRKTVRNYLRSWFIVDFVLVLIDWAVIVTDILNTSGSRSNASALRVAKSVKTMRTLRSIRLLRVVKFPQIFKLVTTSLGRSEYASLCMGIVKHLCSILMVNHLIACLWYLIGKEHHGGWVAYYASDEDWDHLYLMSLHWSLTQFTPSTMAVQPQTVGERLFTVTVIVFALITFSSFVSSITNLMTHLRSLKSTEAKQFDKLERYLHDSKISFHLSLRVRRFLEHSIGETKRRPQEKDVDLILRLSEPLRQELHYEVHSPVVQRHPFFANYSLLNLPAMQKLCHTSVRTTALSTDDVLFNSGETAKSIYFLTGGLCEYIRHVGSREVVKEVQHGEWAAEMVLWTPWEHRGLMKASTESSLHAVSVGEFHQVVSMSKAGQLEASAYAMAVVKTLNEKASQAGNIKGLSDLDGVDPHAICSEVFKAHQDQGKSHHWLRAVHPLRGSERGSFNELHITQTESASSVRSSGGTFNFWSTGSIQKRQSKDQESTATSGSTTVPSAEVGGHKAAHDVSAKNTPAVRFDTPESDSDSEGS
jgi:CRP-like cAMP-binding protein